MEKKVVYKPKVQEEIVERFYWMNFFVQKREQFKADNIEAQMNYDDVNLSGRIQGLTKIKNFLNRLKVCEEQSRAALLKDLQTFNLESYLQETANSIASCVITKDDIAFFMEIISKIHQEYQEFAEYIGVALVKNIISGGKLEDPKKQAVRRKNLLRLLGELVIIEIPFEKDYLFEGFRAALVNKEYNEEFTELNIISAIEFCQQFFEYFFGETSSVVQELAQKHGQKIPKMLEVEDCNSVKKINLWVNQIYMGKLQDILNKKLDKILMQETINQRIVKEGGKVKGDNLENIEKYSQDFERFSQQVQQIIDEINLDIVLPKNETKKIVQTSIAMEEERKHQEIKQLYQDQIVVKEYLFKDEKDQQLYEDFPNLEKIVPQILLTPQSKESEEEDEQNFIPYSELSEEQKNQGYPQDKVQELVMSSYRQCIELLQDCDNIKKADHLASEFCYINNYNHRKYLIQDCLDKYEPFEIKTFMPFRIRVIVILSQFFPLMKEHIEKYIMEKFQRYRDQPKLVFDAEKNIYAFCELVKYQVIDFSILLNCMKTLIDQLTGVKLDLIIIMIEQSGKFLLLKKESKMRFQMMLSFLQKKKDDSDIFDDNRKQKIKVALDSIRTKK